MGYKSYKSCKSYKSYKSYKSCKSYKGVLKSLFGVHALLLFFESLLKLLAVRCQHAVWLLGVVCQHAVWPLGVNLKTMDITELNHVLIKILVILKCMGCT